MAANLPDEKLDEIVKSNHVETAPEFAGLSDDDRAFLTNFSDDRRRKVIRKIDIRLVPLLGLVYLWSFIDRANIGNAKIEGLVTDLNLTDLQYNICLSIFFVPYVLFEVPSNYILNNFSRPSHYMGTIIMAWGVVMTLEGIVKNFAGLVALRVFLGVFESGFFPGAVLIISKWYLPNETQTRIACFYSFSALAGAVSGLLAAGIAQMEGVAGLEPWRWIFILEGIATFLSGTLCFFFLIDSPARSSSWLQPEEIRYLELRQLANRPCSQAPAPASPERRGKEDRRILWSVLTDWQIYLQSLVYWSNTVPNNALKFTMPQIVKNMGFQSTNAQLMTIPPYIIGAISAFTASVFADRFRLRMPFIVAPQLLVVTAYAVLMGKAENIKENMGACYFAVILACIGLYPINPGGNAWALSNLAGPTKRAMGIAFMVCLGNVGGIVGSYIFIEDEAPGYVTGFATSLAFAAAGVAACFCLEGCYTMLNRRREGLDEMALAAYGPELLERMGDRAPTFRYSL